jgi:hypothetical protein
MSETQPRGTRANPPVRHTPRQVAVPLTVSYEDAVSPLGERQIAVLRLLGRLEVLATEWIATLVYPDMNMRQCYRHLLSLYEQGYVWRQRTTMAHVDRTTTSARQKRVPPPRAPYVYGLTPEGRAYLSSVDAEPDAATLEALRVRDRRAPKINEAQLKHDLLVSGWCTSVLHEARKCPMLESVVCQVEYISARDEQGKERQRFDALLILRLNPKQRAYVRSGWAIPWHDGMPPSAECRTARIALEVDRGTEQLSRLYDKGSTYRELTEQKVYEQNLGGNPLVVFLVPAGLRSAQIATEWRDAWPNGPGVISTPKASNHPERGALWGQYFTLKDNPTKAANILDGIGMTLATWESLTKTWTPQVGGEGR